MKAKSLQILLIIALIFINIGCDQSTKFLAKKHLNKSETVRVIDGYFILHYTENSGGFMSLFSSLPKTVRFFLLSFLPSIALALMLYYLIRQKDLPPAHLFSLSCLIGGGVSNIADRILFEHVVDFMNIGIGSIRTGIFNFADLSIMFGSVTLVLAAYSRERKREQTL